MKKYKHLSEKILTLENFTLAYKNATNGKKHYTEVRKIEKNIAVYVKNLLEEVKNKKYKVSDYKVFKKFTGVKLREIYKLPMKDRIVQHAIMNICEPIFRETFIVDTYSSIKTRGTHRCLKRVKKAIKDNNYPYCLKLDIHKCYPSLDKEILKKKLRKKFVDKDLLWLFDIIIDSCEKGVPIGNYTSQYFNNFYFNDFDHWIKEVKSIKYYFRYCDDIIIFGKTKEELWQLFKEIQVKIAKLNVTLKSNYQVFKISDRGLDFLGFVVYEKYTRLRKRVKLNFIKKVKKMNWKDISNRELNVLSSYWGLMFHGDCRNLWKKYTNTKNFAALIKKFRKKVPLLIFLYKPIKIVEAFMPGKHKLHLKICYKENNYYSCTTGKYLITYFKNGLNVPFQTIIKKDSRLNFYFT